MMNDYILDDRIVDLADELAQWCEEKNLSLYEAMAVLLSVASYAIIEDGELVADHIDGGTEFVAKQFIRSGPNTLSGFLGVMAVEFGRKQREAIAGRN